MKNKGYCLICCVGLSFLSIAQPDGVVEEAAQSGISNDFLAVSNSVYKATFWSSMSAGKPIYFPEREVEQVRFLFDLMNAVSTSKVELICFQNSGRLAESGNLSFWITGDAVYKIKHPEILSFEKYTLSISKTARTGVFDSELEAFESIPQKNSSIIAHDAPSGFYTRRTPDGTFQCIYFPIIVEGPPLPIRSNKLPEGAKRIYMQDPNLKIYAFNRLFDTFSVLVEKERGP